MVYFKRRRTIGFRRVKRRRFGTTLKGVSKFRRTIRGRTTKGRLSKYKRVVQRVRPHAVIGRTLDRDHYILSQTLVAKMVWTPVQTSPAGAMFDHGDGFAISMNSLYDTFGISGSIGNTNGGVPTVALPSTHGVVFSFSGASGIGQSTPDGLNTAMNRYTFLCVTRGEYDISLSQDTNGTAALQGSVRMAVCGFPSQTSMTSGGSVTLGHQQYPTTAALSNADEDSMAGLTNEPNCKKAFITPFAGSKTFARIKYPFSIAKYAPPGYITQPNYWQDSPTHIGNPDYNTSQPYILTQFLSDGEQATQVFRVELKMKWYVVGFQRKIVENVD